MKIFKIIVFLLLVAICISSCDILIDGEMESSGYIKGKIVILENNIIGIDGEVHNAGKLYPKYHKVKCSLLQEHSKYLFDTFEINNGDDIEFWFINRAGTEFSDVPWKTVIGIGTDLIVSSEKKVLLFN